MATTNKNIKRDDHQAIKFNGVTIEFWFEKGSKMKEIMLKNKKVCLT